VSDTLTVNPSDPPQLATPEPVFNCPECSHWLPPGTLACPDCGAIVYTQHLRLLALAATAEERADRWSQARAEWQKALNWLPPGTGQYSAVEERVRLIDTRLQREAQKKIDWTRRFGPLAPVLLFLSKAKTVFFFLLKAKFLLSFFAFFAIYWALFGIWFGGGFTLSILLHEMGHWVAAKRRGLKVDLPVFLPGFGAYVRWYSQGVSLDDLSGIALAGPFAGLLTSVGFGVISSLVHPGWWQNLFSALAHVSAWLNLINLVPVLGLDGAQAATALDRTQRWLVLVSALGFFGLFHEWIFLAVAAGMVWRLFQRGAAPQPSTRTLVRFVLLLFTLGMAMWRFPETVGRF
jgi:Zn-dependent protease